MNISDVLTIADDVLKNNRLFFVCGLYGSSGSFFLNTLFDGHPDIYTFPSDIRRIPIFVDDFEAHTAKEHISAVLDNNKRFFDTSAVKLPNNTLQFLGENKDQGIAIDKNRFITYFTAILDNMGEFNIRNYTLAIVMAYNFTRNIFPSTNTFVLYTHDLLRTAYWKRQFGPCKIVTSCRHPLNVYASYCDRTKYESLIKNPLLLPYRLTKVWGFLDFYKVLSRFEDDIGLVLLEELSANPKQSMELVVQNMNINFCDSLLQSTIGGLKWWGSHQRIGTINGFSKTLHRTVRVDFVGKNAEAAMLKCTGHFQRFIGYERRPKPTWREYFRSYMFERIFFLYYKDLITSVINVMQSEMPLSSLIRIMLRAFKWMICYCAWRVKDSIAIAKLAKEDAAADYSRLKVLNPLHEGSMELRKEW